MSGKRQLFADTQLTLAQQEAVAQPAGPLAIVAGAGSGKTNTLTARAIQLIRVERIAPANVLAITFSNAAVKTLKARLVAHLGHAGEAVHVVTFHSFARWIVAQHFQLCGYTRAPDEPRDVLHDEARDELLVRAFRRAGAAPPPRVLEAMRLAVDEARIARALEGYVPYHPSHAAVLEVVERYEALRVERNCLDYLAMLLDAVRILRESEVALRRMQLAYDAVLADEVQDADAVQWTLLRMLVARHGNLTAVGDPMQSLVRRVGA